MKAVVAHTLGPPETLSLETVERPALGPTDVRVVIHYAGVSFVDVLTATGGYQLKPPTPFIPGTEFSGVVLETGAQASRFAPGDRVCGGSFGKVFAEEIVVDEGRLQPAPKGVTMAEAAVLRASYFTAFCAVVDRAHTRPGETVVVLGAAGAVGIAAVQIAKSQGAMVIASASSPEKRALALANGADHAVDSRGEDWRGEIKRLTEGRGVDVVVDPLGGDNTERAFRALRWGGRLVVIGFAAGDIPKIPTNLVLLKGGALLGVDMRQFSEVDPEGMADLTRRATALFDTGVARPPIGKVYPLSGYVAAMQAAQNGDSAGRIVLRMPAADSD